jgi:Arc/MetJ-type ribon-helix-helix transcriptional regulator
MKLSVSISEQDVATLDQYARQAGLPSRSAALHRAIRLLAEADLERDYEAAWIEWESSGAQTDWESAPGDGLNDQTR